VNSVLRVKTRVLVSYAQVTPVGFVSSVTPTHVSAPSVFGKCCCWLDVVTAANPAVQYGNSIRTYPFAGIGWLGVIVNSHAPAAPITLVPSVTRSPFAIAIAPNVPVVGQTLTPLVFSSYTRSPVSLYTLIVIDSSHVRLIGLVIPENRIL
jgi:hypothetical protein